MTIKVLHIFAPSLAHRFSGDSIWWRSVFRNWNAADIIHYGLDYSKCQLIHAENALGIEESNKQSNPSQGHRAAWIYFLFKNLMKYRRAYDILHVHVLWWGGLLIGPWAKWNGIPALYESVLLDSDTPWAIVKEKFGRAKIFCLKCYRSILAISGYLAEEYLSFGFSKPQVFTLPHYVDLDLFSPSGAPNESLILRQELGLPVDAKMLVFVGSVIERKGADILVQAFIDASFKHSDLHLLIVGPKDKRENPSVDEDFINDLCLLLERNHLSEHVTFAGLVRDREKLAEIYRAADIFVFPSRNEGLPNVLLEAMASGLPVIVSRLPGLETVIQHEENGVFIPIDDAEALCDSILNLIDKPLLGQQLGCKARRYVEENHGFETWQAQLIKVYEDLLSLSRIKEAG